MYKDDNEFMLLFGERIKFLRSEKKISQTDLAGKAELEKSAIQRIERGYNSTIKTLIKLANAFDISVSELLGIENGNTQK